MHAADRRRILRKLTLRQLRLTRCARVAGVYIRRNPPNTRPARPAGFGDDDEDDEDDGGARRADGRQYLLYYEHMDTPWTMSLTEELDRSQRWASLGSHSEWCFSDEKVR